MSLLMLLWGKGKHSSIQIKRKVSGKEIQGRSQNTQRKGENQSRVIKEKLDPPRKTQGGGER